MAEEGLLYGERTWFFDPRSPMRRMAVASHPEQGLVVLSLWTGDTCTGTFRLPMADAALMISALANSLAVTIPTGPGRAAPQSPRGWRAFVARIRRRPKLAEVVRLRAVK
jgi:hypothetical protein